MERTFKIKINDDFAGTEDELIDIKDWMNELTKIINFEPGFSVIEIEALDA